MTDLATHLIHDNGYMTIAYPAGHTEPAESEIVSPIRLVRGVSGAYPSVGAPTAHLARSVLLTRGDSGPPAELAARVDNPAGTDVPGQRPAADSPEGAAT